MDVICLVRREHHGQLSMLTLMHIIAIEASSKQCYQGNQAQRYNAVYIFVTVLCNKYSVSFIFILFKMWSLCDISLANLMSQCKILHVVTI